LTPRAVIPYPYSFFLSLFSSVVVLLNMSRYGCQTTGLAAFWAAVLCCSALDLHVGLRWYVVAWSEWGWHWLGYVTGQSLLLALLTLVSGDPALWLLLLVWLLGDAVGVWQQGRTIAVGVVIYLAVGITSLLAATGWQTTLDWLVATLPTAVVIMVISLLYRRQVNAREEAQELVTELAAANRQISAYAQEVERLTLAQERQRMARELHDTLAQGVAGMIMQLEAANSHLINGRHDRAQTIVQDTMAAPARPWPKPAPPSTICAPGKSQFRLASGWPLSAPTGSGKQG
jgi:two-component system, NarL family, sensor histidine kinase YdfH